MSVPTNDSIFRRDIVGWSLYDFANTIYSMNIVSLYLKRYIVEDLGFDDRYYDIPFAISMLLAALLLPALGAMSDHGAKKKLFLFLFTTTCCLSVAGLAIVPEHLVLVLVGLFIIANFSYEAGQPFYNALLYSVADGPFARYVSGFGVALGYVGSIVGMVLVLPFVTGDLFGLELPIIEAGGKAAAFFPTAVLFILFAAPVFLWVREQPNKVPQNAGLMHGYREIFETVRSSHRYPGAIRFLIADYCFEDAAATVIINIGLYCSLVIGMADGDITLFLIISTASAVVGSYLVGVVARHWSLKKLLVLIVWGWVLALILFVLTEQMAIIWMLGSLVGILLGGLWTVTRPMLAELVPREQLGRFFGLFALSGRAAAVVGPLLWTTIIYFFRPGRQLGDAALRFFDIDTDAQWLPYKLAVLSLAGVMLVGLVILRKVPEPLPGGPHAV
jgi:UMF1 family MFS transporter